ncbi:MAG: hypothetical protein RL319_887 [Actinomycetota bacterium]
MPLWPEMKPAEAYSFALPKSNRPICIIGAGGIVRDAHLPAYKKAGFNVWGIVNRTKDRAEKLAFEYRIENVFDNLKEAVMAAPENCVFDIALMPEQYEATLESLPDGSAVLIQKPLGNDLESARVLSRICERKKLVAAVNTQLRFAPYIEKARQIIAAGTLGDVFDFQIRISVNTPWELFPHVFGAERLEISMHSVHYVDLVRSIFGDPDSVSAITVRHPEKTNIATTRSNIIFRYQDRPLRVLIDTNHDNNFGTKYQESGIFIQGTKGALKIQMGLLLDYPKGGPDYLEMYLNSEPEKDWQSVSFDGSWFPDAFMGSMGVVQRYLEGSIAELPTSVSDVVRTMAAVEAAYHSSDHEGVKLDFS